MARIDALPAERAGWLTRLIYREARRRYGQVPEPAVIQAHHRGILVNTVISELGNQRVLRRLDGALRELVTLRVATLVGCSWCIDFGAMLATKQGMTSERLRNLHDYARSGAYTAAEKAALAYADAVTAQPMTVTDEQVAALETELGADGLVELTYVIALENHRARFNHALGITAQGFTSGDACPVPVSASTD